MKKTPHARGFMNHLNLNIFLFLSISQSQVRCCRKLFCWERLLTLFSERVVSLESATHSVQGKCSFSNSTAKQIGEPLEHGG